VIFVRFHHQTKKGYKLLKFLVTLNLFIGGGNRI
jgi:hypothetical protein